MKFCRKSKWVFGLLALLSSGSVMALSCFTSSCVGKVDFVRAVSSSSDSREVLIKLYDIDKDVSGKFPSGCTLASDSRFRLADSNGAFDEIFQMAQTSYLQDVQVRLGVIAGSSPCQVSYLSWEASSAQRADMPGPDAHAVISANILNVTTGNPGHYGTRAYLDVADPNANGKCNATFAYIEKTPRNDNNFEAKTSAILTAFSTNKSANWVVESGRGGYCRIVNIRVLGN